MQYLQGLQERENDINKVNIIGLMEYMITDADNTYYGVVCISRYWYNY